MCKNGLPLSLLFQRRTKYFWVFFGFLSVAPALADIVSVDGSGQHSFGPNTSEQKACELAEEQLISNAARSHFGERIEFNETQVCSGPKVRSSGIACDLEQRMFFSIDESLSILTVTVSEKTVLYPQSTKRYSCNITGTVRFDYSKSTVDQDWITSLDVDQKLLAEDNQLAFKANSSEKGFHYIFEDQGPLGFSLIFPNEMDVSRSIAGAFSVPSSSAKRAYKISPGRAAEGASRDVLSFLMISTKEGLDLRRMNASSISRDQLRSLKETLKPSTWTQKRLVIRSQQ